VRRARVIASVHVFSLWLAYPEPSSPPRRWHASPWTHRLSPSRSSRVRLIRCRAWSARSLGAGPHTVNGKRRARTSGRTRGSGLARWVSCSACGPSGRDA